VAITLFYYCDCGMDTATLDVAQQHANDHRNDPTHVVRVEGTITANAAAVADVVQIEQAAAQRLRESAIMRAARDKGLLPDVKRGVR
jgi:hypothetical protein